MASANHFADLRDVTELSAITRLVSEPSWRVRSALACNISNLPLWLLHVDRGDVLWPKFHLRRARRQMGTLQRGLDSPRVTHLRRPPTPRCYPDLDGVLFP